MSMSSTRDTGRKRSARYSCVRCACAFDQPYQYKRHIQRKTPCQPSRPELSGVLPTMDNLVTLGAGEGDGHEQAQAQAQAQAPAPAAAMATVDVPDAPDTPAATPAAAAAAHGGGPRAFGEEDMSHVTPSVVRTLLERRDVKGRFDLVAAVVKLAAGVHFCMAKPENMTVFALDSPTALALSAKVYSGEAWVAVDKDTAAVQVARHVVAHVAAMLASAPGLVSPECASAFALFSRFVHHNHELVGATLDLLRECGWLVAAQHPGVLDGRCRRSPAGAPIEF
jgi:hypothetical protein